MIRGLNASVLCELSFCETDRWDEFMPRLAQGQLQDAVKNTEISSNATFKQAAAHLVICSTVYILCQICNVVSAWVESVSPSAPSLNSVTVFKTYARRNYLHLFSFRRRWWESLPSLKSSWIPMCFWIIADNACIKDCLLQSLMMCLCVCVGVTLSWGTRWCRRSLSPSQRSPTCRDTKEAAAPESRSPKDWRKFTMLSNKAWSE